MPYDYFLLCNCRQVRGQHSSFSIPGLLRFLATDREETGDHRSYIPTIQRKKDNPVGEQRKEKGRRGKEKRSKAILAAVCDQNARLSKLR